jgi:hypothetical protein
MAGEHELGDSHRRKGGMVTMSQKNVDPFPVHDGMAGDCLESWTDLADAVVAVALHACDAGMKGVQESDDCPGIEVIFFLVGARVGDVPQEDELLALFLVV